LVLSLVHLFNRSVNTYWGPDTVLDKGDKMVYKIVNMIPALMEISACQ
jgi:hypothetical protein